MPIVEKYEEKNGTWIRNSWSLYGRTGPTLLSALRSSSSASAASASRATAAFSRAEDLLGVSTATIGSASTSTAAASATTATRSVSPGNNHAAESSGTSISVPAGWKPPERATNLYAVPVIITISVLVAMTLVGTIVGSVIWRKRRRTRTKGKRLRDLQTGEKGEKGIKARAKRAVGKVGRRKPSEERARDEGDDGDGEGSGGAGLARVASNASRRVATGIAVGTAGRLRERRRMRAARASVEGDRDDDEEDEARTALTGGSGSGSVPETLTARLSARMRASVGRQSESPRSGHGPSTVFSEPLVRSDTVSTTGSGASLTRSASVYDGASLRTIPSRSSANQSSELLDHQHSGLDDNALSPLSTSTSRRQSSALGGPGLPLPATSPSLASSSSFGQFLSGVEAALPSFGPPAYRPNSTTIQATSRLTSSLLGRGARRQARRMSVDEERAEPDPLLWPEEKRALRARARGAEVQPSAPVAEAEEEAQDLLPEHQVPAEPEIARSEYAAHLATDDKAVLARLREHAQASAAADAHAEPSTSGARAHAEASAPAVEDDDDDLDEDGFERVPAEIPTIVVDGPSLLPLPPVPVLTRSQCSFGTPGVSRAASRASVVGAELESEPGPDVDVVGGERVGMSRVAMGKRAEARRSAVEVGAEEDEESFLPVYLPRAVAMASASAPGGESDDDDDEVEDEGGVGAAQEAGGGAGGREEHAVI